MDQKEGLRVRSSTQTFKKNKTHLTTPTAERSRQDKRDERKKKFTKKMGGRAIAVEKDLFFQSSPQPNYLKRQLESQAPYLTLRHKDGGKKRD